MAEPNTTWRVNQKGMNRCCYFALQHEMYRRKNAGEELMIEGHTLKCPDCHSEMICDKGTKDKLRWRRLPEPPVALTTNEQWVRNITPDPPETK